MNRAACWTPLVCLGLLLTFAIRLPAAESAWPFYAMDNAFAPPARKSLSLDEGLALVKELGYAGVAWHEKSPDEVRADLAAIEKHGLKMFAIYSPAKIAPDGDLTLSANAVTVMELLKGHCDIFWIHIGGKGPDFGALGKQSPAVVKLRALAETAKANRMKIAIYPHLGEWTAQLGDATRLAKLVDHPHCGVSFNLCHCLATGDESRIAALLEEARPVLLAVTICGADSGVDLADKQRWKRLIRPLGQGTFDMGGLLAKLRQVGYHGPIGFQAYGIAGEPREILAPTIEAWRKLSAAATDK